MSLTYTAHVARRTIKFGGAGLVLLAISYSLITYAIEEYKRRHPPYVPPTVRYGVLPKLAFPEKEFQKKNFSFEFANDAPPQFKDQAKVFVVYQPNTTFLALDLFKDTARQMGFPGEPVELKPNVYKFNNDSRNQELTVNILDGSFKMAYPYLTDQLLLNPERMPTQKEAIEIATGYLNAADKYPPDLEEGEKKVTFWKISFDGLKSQPALSGSNIIRIDFFRKEIEGVEGVSKIISSDPNQAAVSILVSGSNTDGRKVVEANFKYANIGRDSFETYPIKTSQQAVEDLKKGNYWPAIDSSKNDVAIREMYLAYYEPSSLTNYMQPIYVFEGENNFTAYVPAITDEYLK